MKLAKHTITKLALVAGFLLYTELSTAQVATFSFSGSSGDETSFAVDAQPTNATISNVTRGSGLTAFTYSDGFNAYQWGAAATIDLNDYYEFTVTPYAGHEVTLTSLIFDGRYVDPMANDTYFWTLRSSLDNFSTNISVPTGVAATQGASPSIQTNNTVDLTGGAFDDLTSPVTFRLYVYDVTNPGNFEWGIDNVDINGSISTPNNVIETIDFETVNYTLNTATSSGGSPATSFFDVFAVADHGTDHAFNGGPPIGTQGNKYLGYRNGTTVGSNNMVTSPSVDVSGFENLSLVFSLANIDLGDGYEVSDVLTIEYQFDGGGYQFLTQWAGDGGGGYMTEDADGSGGGDGVVATELGSQFKSFERAIPKEGAMMDIRITMLTSVEDVIVDNMAITGTTDLTAPLMANATQDNSTQITVTFNESVQTNETNPTDFTVVDGIGTNYTVSAQADGTSNDDQIVLTVADMSAAAGDITVTYTNNNSEVQDLAGNDLATDGTGVLIDDVTPPAMASATQDNSTQITVTYDEPVQTNETNPADFTVVDGQGTNFTVSAQADGTPNDTDIVLTVADMSTAVGDITVTYTNNSNEIFDFGGNNAPTDGVGVTIDTDATAPQIASATQDNNTQITVTYDEPVQTNETNPTDFTVVDGQGTNFTVSAQADGTPDDTEIVLTVADMSTAVGDITVTYTNNSNEIFDFGGNNAPTDGIGATIDTDAAPPLMSSAVQDNSTQITITFNEDVQTNGTNPTDFTVTDGLANNFAVSAQADGTPDDADIVLTVADMSTAAGDITITYTNNSNEIFDFGGNFLATDGTGVVIADVTQPSITGITRADADPNNAGSVDFTVTFNEPVLNVATSDFALTVSGGISGHSITGIAGSNDTYTLTVNTGTGDGTIRLDLNDLDNSITDIAAASNTLSPNTFTSGEVYSIDKTVPEVASIERQTPSSTITNANTVTFRVTFDEDVLNVDQTDFTLSGTASGSITGANTVNASTYDIDVTGVSGDGNLNLDFAANNITDLAGNIFGGTINAEEEYTVDNITPIATITTIEDGEQSNFEITFNEQLATATTGITNISNLLTSAINDPADDNESISVSSVPASVSWNLSIPSAPVATVTIPLTTFVSGEILRINFINNIVQDVAGNGISSATNVDGTITDVTPPALSPDIMSFSDNGAAPETIVFTMSEELDFIEGGTVTGFTYGAGIAITNAVYSDKGLTNTITLTSSSNGQWTTSTLISYTQVAGDVLDLAGLELSDIVNHPVELNVVNLTAGDIAFTGYNSDNPNDFSFVLLKDVEAGTEIKFTDQGWKAPGFGTHTDDGTSTWSTTTFLFAGTEISVSGSTVTGGGSITAQVDLSTDGDQIIAYQGAIGNNLTFIAGIHMDNQHFDNTTKWTQLAQAGNQENRSVVPDGLTAGLETVTPENGGEQDNGVYDQSVVSGNRSTVRTAINDHANWNTSNSRVTITSGDNFDLSPDILSVSPANGSMTNANPGNIVITFDENISPGLSTLAGDIQLNLDDGTPVLAYNIGDPEVVFGTNNITIDISAAQPLSDGVTYEVDLVERILVNADGNANKAIVGDTDWKFTVDAVAPTVNTINRDPAVTVNANNGTVQSSVSYIVTFNEDVVPGTVNSTDFTLAGTASGGTASINTTITGTGDTYTVTVDNINQLGTLTINFTGDIDDLVGNTGSTFKAGDESFFIINPEPSEQPTTFSAVPGADNFTLDLSWTAGGGAQLADGYLVYYQETPASFPADPADLTEVVNGPGAINTSTNSVSVSGLNSGIQYDFKVYPYTNSGNQIDYKIDGTILTGNGTTGVGQQSLLFFGTDAASISSISNTLGSAVVNLSFFVADDWANPSIDNADTRITQFSFHPKISGNDINWVDAIEGAQLSDGTNVWNTDANGGDITIDNTQITFSNIPTGTGQLGEITDSNFKEYFLSIWIKSSILDAALRNDIDGKNFAFEIDQAGFTFDANSSEVAAGQVVSSGDTRNAVSVIATGLDWETQPPALAGVLAPFTSAPIVEATDDNGNRDLQYAGAVSDVSNAGGLGMNNNPDATGLNHAFASGIYTFDITAGTGFNYQSSGDGTLTVTSTGLTPSPASSTVTVSYSDGTTVTNGPDPEAATISSLRTSYLIDDYAFDFRIRDDASTVVDDKVGTVISQIVITSGTGTDVITSNWSDIIGRALLYNELTGQSLQIFSGPNITNNSLIFDLTANPLGTIADGEYKDIRLYVALKSSITGGLDNTIDNDYFNFNVSDVSITTEAASSTLANSQLVESGATNNKIIVVSTEIVFEQQPPTEHLVNTDFGANAPIVEAIDIYGNRDLDYAESVIVTDVTPSEAFINPPPANFSNGVLVFPANFQYTQVAASTQLNINPQTPVTPGPLPAINSNAFEIRVGKGNTITPGGTPEPATISSLETSDPGIFVFDFDINDDAGSEDDGVATLIESMSITQGSGFNDPNFTDWTDVIAGAEISDGTNQLNSNANPGNVTITASEIQFSGISTTVGTLGYIGDDATKTYSLKIWLKDQIDYRISNDLINPPTLFADGKKLEFQIHEDKITTFSVGSSFEDNEFVESGDANAIEVEATDLEFVRQPVDGVSFAPFNIPQPRIAAVDVNLNTDIDYAEPVLTFTNSLTLDMVNSPGPADLGESFAAGLLELDVNFGFEEDGVNLTFDISTDAGSGYGAFSKTSDQFTVNASEESSVTFTSASINIPYKDHLLPTNKFVLGTFTLTDGDGATDDADEADTNLDQLEITITNPGYIDEIGLFDQSGTEVATIPTPGATETFTGFLITAPDGLGSSVNFTVRANFNTSVVDNEAIELSITNASTAGGSKLDPGNTLPSVPLGNNIISVIATEYVFTQSPAAIEGVNVPFNSPPFVQAQDENGALDLDYSQTYTLTSENASIDQTAISATFINGELDLANLRYTTPGYGTLTIMDNITTANSGLAQSTDVISSTLQNVTVGVSPAGDLPSRGVNKALLGFSLDARSNTTNEPVFQSVTINTSNDTTNIFENFEIYELVTFPAPSTPIIGTDLIKVTGSKVNKGSSTANSIVLDGFNEVLDPTTGVNVYYIVSDISAYAYSGTPATSLSVAPAGFTTSSGSLNGTGFSGFAYTFTDFEKPQYTLFPANGSTTFDPLSNEMIITFDEPVNPLDTAFTIFLFADDSEVLVSNTLLDISVGGDQTKFSIAIPDLSPDTKYYVNFLSGSVANNVGFIDRDNNSVDGINNSTDWQFTTADNIKPEFIGTPAITNIYNNGFDIEVQLDEEGKVYYMVLENNGTPPSIAQLVGLDVPTPSDSVTVGEFEITQGFLNHYISISGLAQDTDYDVFLIPEDIFGNISTNNADIAELLNDKTTDNSGSNVVVFDAEATLCVGQFQEILDPIHIIEQSNDTFDDTGGMQTLSLILPAGFTFNTSVSPEITYTLGADINSTPVATFFSNSVLNIDYELSGEANIDKITIRNLFIKADATASTGSIIKSGDASMQGAPFGKVLGTLNAVTPSPVSFITDPANSSISIDLEGETVELIPSLNDGQNIFEGTAVSGNLFNVQFAGVGSHLITLTHIDEFGCESTFSKTVEVIDDAIDGLNSEYCANVTSEGITSKPDTRPGFTLIDLKLETAGIANPGETNSLTDDGNNWIFNPFAASFGGSQNVALDFVGVYQNDGDISIKDTITQRVNVYVVPSVNVSSITPGALGNSIDHCEDGGLISLDATPKPVLGISNGIFTISDGSGGFVSDPALTDNGDGTASLEPQGLPPGNLDIRYVYTNDTTSCSIPDTLTVSINEEPVVEIAQTTGCEGIPVTLENTTSGNIISRNWNFDDEGVTFPTTDPLQNLATHTYENSGSYNVTLSLTTDKGCSADNNASPFVLNVGGIPNPGFNFTGVDIEDTFTFENNTGKPGTLTSDTVNTLTWDLGDGNITTVERVDDTDDLLTYNYASTFIDTVSLTVTSSLGCEATLSKPIAVLEKYNAANAPANGYESGTEGWTIIDPNNNSWARSDNNGDIDQAGNFMWVTNPNNSYLSNERSYVYSPSLDISTVSRPLIQFDAYWDLATGDGVILEYSTDNLNVTDPAKTWNELGEIGSGEDWYNGDNLPSIPGGGTIDFGWAGSFGMQEPKHIFDSIPALNRTNVNLRFGLSSVNANPGRPGFAFDNLFIGSRTRTVLVENFTNTSKASNTKFESDFLASFEDTDQDGTIMIKINYHTDFPGKDPLNDANIVDPGARALYYNIEQTPRAVIDGTIYQNAPFSEWGQTQFQLRSLILAQYQLDVNVTTSDGAIVVEAIPTPQNNAVLNSSSIIIAAILEKDVLLSEIGIPSVNSGETSFEYVLRKLLPNAAGVKLNTDAAQSQQPMEPVNFSWIPSNVVDLNDMAVVVFIQDELTKEVYQSEIELNVPAPDQVTGFDDEITTSFSLFPNPANDRVTIVFDTEKAKDNRLSIFDTFGKLVYSQTIDPSDESIEVDTRNFSAGLYHVQMNGKDGLPVRKRLMVVPRQ